MVSVIDRLIDDRNNCYVQMLDADLDCVGLIEIKHRPFYKMSLQSCEW